MPNQPATPNRSIRSPDEIWLPAKAKAEDNGETITDVVNRLLKDYGKDYQEYRPAIRSRLRRKRAGRQPPAAGTE